MIESSTSSGQIRTFVVRNERERLLAVFAELVHERGYEATRLADVAARGGVEPTVVDGYFESELECGLAAVDAASEQCFSAASEAFVSTPGDCPRAAHATLDAMLRFMASVPALVHLAVLEYPHLGEEAEARRQRHMRLFGEFLGPGFAVAGELPPEPELIAQLIAGGIFEVLRGYALAQRIEQLPDALPAISFFTVAPFFGIEEARRVAALPSPIARGAGQATR